MDNDNLVEKVQKEVDEEQIRRIFQALRADEEIQKICGGQADFLINVARANMIVSRVEQRYDEKLSAELLKLKNDLTEKYPIRSKINR